MSVGIIILVIALIILIQPYPREVREAYGSYSMNTEMTLSDQLRNNSLYGNNTTLSNPPLIYNNITRDLYVNVDVSYLNSQVTNSQIEFSYSVYVVSSNPSWEKGVYYSQKLINVTSGYSSSFVIGVNLTSNLTFGSNINRELGFSSGSSYSVFILSREISNLGVSDSNLTIAIGGATNTVTGPSDTPVSGTYFKDAVIPGKIIIPLSRDTSYPLLLIVAIIFGFFAYLIRPEKPDPVEKFKRDNRENLIELAAGPSEESIKVKSTDDLFRMAAFVERPVFIFNNIIFIEIDGKTYYAEINK